MWDAVARAVGQATQALDRDNNFFWLLLILIVLFIILDAFSALAKSKSKLAGVKPEINNVLFPSAIFRETRSYSSEIQGLKSNPDALLVENGYLVPVDRKLYSNKVRDRYIVELLIHMRLIEEFEGKRPPYGYLILGKKARRVKVSNTEKRQKWLDQLIFEINAIREGHKQAIPDPHPRKCTKCKVLEYCEIGQKRQNSSV